MTNIFVLQVLVCKLFWCAIYLTKHYFMTTSFWQIKHNPFVLFYVGIIFSIIKLYIKLLETAWFFHFDQCI